MKSLLLVLAVIRHTETRSVVKRVVEGAGHRLIECDGYRQAQSLASNGLHPDLLLLECAPGGPSEKLEYLGLLGSMPKTRICVIAGIGERRLCTEAAGFGVEQFVMKPVTHADIESVLDCLRDEELAGADEFARDCSESSSQQHLHTSSERVPSPFIEELGDDRFFLAASPAMLEIHRQAKLLADVDVTVLITGESGTGKEVVAQLIHKYSRRSRLKMLKVNCAALPADLLESELFGHRQGAFTGAVKDRAGLFEQANRGTLMLDEIGEISAQMQAKLLHVLQDGHFTRLGGQESTRVDVRILAATNVQMESALREKSFREDLYYRLSAFTMHVPPLRERREEIPFLIDESIRRAPAEMKSGSSLSFSSELVDAALQYDWPGNLRELRNFVTRTIIMRDQSSAVRELEARIASRESAAQNEEAVPRGESVSDLANCSGMRSVVRDLKERTEMQMIQEALDAAGWNRRHAAQHLNISYRALLYKIQQHRLSPRKAARGVSEKFRSGYSVRGSAV